ncbi:SDR family oxidoreductase [Microbacterium sp. NPDC089189]|uniref:SDR family NAD(P)-dependent oxidoreductase n=1 Tax=Microbacterium sp. NPDC089189 TaxID=3154972 RepID=UPI0034172CDB
MTLDETPTTDKVAIITGAGRARGMGRAIALRFAAAGVKTVVTDLGRTSPTGAPTPETSAELEETAHLARELGADSIAVACDSTSGTDVARTVSIAMARFGRIDVLVNNAGTSAGAGAFAEFDEDLWNLSWNVNVMGAVRMIRAALPELSKNRGAVVNTTSTLGLGGSAYYGAYVVTKHGVTGLTRLLAAELGPLGVRVNAVAPGFIHTDMGQAELESIAQAHGITVDEATHGMLETIPQRRLGAADDVADAVQWLALGAAFTNGEILTVHGGAASGLT